MVILAFVTGLLIGPSIHPKVEVEQCPAVDIARLDRLIQLEAEIMESEVEVLIKCRRDAIDIELNVNDHHVVRSVVGLTGDHEVIERYLAVEVTELIASTATVGQPSVPEPPRTPKPPPKPVVATLRWGWLAFGGRGELGGTPWLVSGGGAIHWGLWLAPHLAIRGRAEGMSGGRSVSAGTLQKNAMWGALEGLATFGPEHATVLVGAGARLGGVWLRGKSKSPDISGVQHQGLSASVFGSVNVLISITPRLALHAGADFGGTLRPIQGFHAQQRVFTNAGPWLGITAGVAMNLGNR